ncbi:MAG: amino acid transport protein [Acinetobacter sp.]
MDTTALLLGVVFSSIGLGYCMYGKKRQHTSALICGIALMIYSYFFDSTAAIIALGLIFMLLPKFVRI